jgi:hypothetical protein
MASGRVDNIVADDAYYYFEIARNAAAGQGFTFDGLAPTNGFHPLWGWLLVPVYWLFPADYWLPIYIAVALSLACMVATALVMFRLFVRHGCPRAGEIAAYAWLLNPFSIALVFRAMEGPLNVLMLMISISALDAVRGRGRFGPGELAWLGATAGLAFLARSENLLWLASMGVVLAWDLRKVGGLVPAATRLACFAGGLLVVTSPWLIWNLVTFGTVVQTSGEAKQMFQLYGRLPPIAPAGGLWPALHDAVRNLLLVAQSNFRYAAGEEWGPPRMANWLAGITGAYAAIVAICAFALRRRWAPEGTGLRALGRNVGAAVGLFFAAHFLVYTFQIGSYYNWYFLPPVLVVCLAQGLSLGFLSSFGRAWGWAFALAHVALLVAVSYTFTAGHFPPKPPRRDRAYQQIGRSLPAGTRIGLWNAGEVGYFFSFHFPDRSVINLDGVVNNEVTRHAREGRYEQYVLEHVDVLIEPPRWFGNIVGKQRADAFTAKHVSCRGKAGGRTLCYLVE